MRLSGTSLSVHQDLLCKSDPLGECGMASFLIIGLELKALYTQNATFWQLKEYPVYFLLAPVTPGLELWLHYSISVWEKLLWIIFKVLDDLREPGNIF